MIGFVNTVEFEIPEPHENGGYGGPPKQEVVLGLKLGGAYKKM